MTRKVVDRGQRVQRGGHTKLAMSFMFSFTLPLAKKSWTSEGVREHSKRTQLARDLQPDAAAAAGDERHLAAQDAGLEWRLWRCHGCSGMPRLLQSPLTVCSAGLTASLQQATAESGRVGHLTGDGGGREAGGGSTRSAVAGAPQCTPAIAARVCDALTHNGKDAPSGLAASRVSQAGPARPLHRQQS